MIDDDTVQSSLLQDLTATNDMVLLSKRSLQICEKRNNNC